MTLERDLGVPRRAQSSDQRRRGVSAPVDRGDERRRVRRRARAGARVRPSHRRRHGRARADRGASRASSPAPAGRSGWRAWSGVAAAKELILTGRRVTARGARYALGIVSDVVPRRALAEAAARSPTRLRRRGRWRSAAAKRAIDGGVGLPLAEGLALEAACYEEVLASEDRNEGLAAFAEKRPPVFKGRTTNVTQ